MRLRGDEAQTVKDEYIKVQNDVTVKDEYIEVQNDVVLHFYIIYIIKSIKSKQKLMVGGIEIGTCKYKNCTITIRL
jgi:hypothetical protein